MRTTFVISIEHNDGDDIEHYVRTAIQQHFFLSKKYVFPKKYQSPFKMEFPNDVPIFALTQVRGVDWNDLREIVKYVKELEGHVEKMEGPF